MNKPTRRNTITLRCWRTDGMKIIKGIVGLIDYPLAIHRPITEFEEIQQDFRTRYSGDWQITHIPTGKGMGIRSCDWESIVQYITVIKDHPVLLMVTDETMTGHPMYSDLCTLHSQSKKKWGL